MMAQTSHQEKGHPQRMPFFDAHEKARWEFL
jgi:hypothetical protein